MGRKPDPNKKQHIIRTAAVVFAQKGYAGTRMIAIADAAGIGKGTIYEYFRNKEALFFAVFQYIVEAPMGRIFSTPASSSGSAAHRLKHVAEQIIDAWLSNLEMYSLVMEFWSAATALPSRQRFKDAFGQVYKDMRGLAAGLIQEGIDSDEFDSQTQTQEIAAAMVGALDSFLLQAWIDKDFDARNISRTFMNHMIKGLQCTKEQV
jgi:AcrR family transcriptional regulator